MNGFLRIAAGVPLVTVASCTENVQQIINLMEKAHKQQVSLIAFPELCIPSCSCGDLYADDLLLDEAKKSLLDLIEKTADLNLIGVVGLPLKLRGKLLNVAVVFGFGEIYGIVPKMSGGVNRHFALLTKDVLDYLDFKPQEEVTISTGFHFKLGEATFSVCFADDFLTRQHPKMNTYEDDFVVLLSSQSEILGKSEEILSLLSAQSNQYNTAYIYASPGFGESSTDEVYIAKSALIDDGQILIKSNLDSIDNQLIISEFDISKKQSLRLNRDVNVYASNGNFDVVELNNIEVPVLGKLVRKLEKNPFIPAQLDYATFANDALMIQAMGLVKRLRHIHGEKVVIGVSGGLDSTLALLVCMKAIDILKLPRKNIIGITMPGFGTSIRTKNNADILMEQMGISVEEISIKEACIQHFKDINHDINVHDVTYENSQARERTQILMDYANKHNALVIGTGDLSELALGWATYNGDHMSMYGVNASIPKTMVQYLVRAIAMTNISELLSTTLLDILDTPISPELTPTSSTGTIQQKTEDLVGPYELHDFFIYHMMKYGFSPLVIFERAKIAFEDDYDEVVIKKWLRVFYKRFFMQQFKRSCSPDGPNVTGVSLSPRGGWIMPSDAVSEMWLRQIDGL